MSKVQEVHELVARGEARPDLTQPSIRGLAWLLRHREHWPVDFEWYYGSCLTCAMGLAIRLWHIPVNLSSFHPYGTSVGKALGLPWEAASHIFYGARPPEGPTREVSPEDVAQAIDDYLLRREKQA